MFRRKRNFWKEKKLSKDIAPEDIFIDSSNLPEFNTDQFEGRLERPIGRKSIIFLSIFFLVVGLTFSGRVWYLQVIEGEELRERSEDNNLRNILQFPERGIIYDRNETEMAWNSINEDNPDFPKREYLNEKGLSHLLGFIDYPKKDTSGKYYEYNIEGRDGVEKSFDEVVGGQTGSRIVESDVFGEVVSESVIDNAKNGKNLNLSIDWRVQSQFYKFIESVALEAEFQGGAGVMMDVNTGEILAMASYPEFNSQIITDGEDSETISKYNQDERKPFLNRAVSGLYTPGSIIKPFIALAALNEDIISPQKEILSTGSLSVPNPYDPKQESVFKDWKAHGYVDMRDAIAVSSNVYFYTIGGGHKDQAGLGISKIERYLEDFGFGHETGINIGTESEGIVPNPRWKKDVFNDDWRLGDTYITSIGQFGFQITPIQAARSTAFLANSGDLLNPTILKTEKPDIEKKANIPEEEFKIIQEGMRMAVTDGTASPLNFPYVKVAAKTGTAEIGALKESVNSWIVGYFPYENPKYAFAVVMERRKSQNPIGGLFVMTQMIDWMHINTPEYLGLPALKNDTDID